jgi:hypothetical protein
MKKDFLNKVKGAILSKEEAKTISGGYDYPVDGINGSGCGYAICYKVFYYTTNNCSARVAAMDGWKVAYGQVQNDSVPYRLCVTK